VLVAAGRAERFGQDKVWATLGDRPVVAHALRALAVPPVERVALVVTRERVAVARALICQLSLGGTVVCGGARRQDSVRNGLLALGPCDWVVVHDAARPLAKAELLLRTLAAAETTGAAVAALPVRDTIKRVRDGSVVETLRREELWQVQTPQVFRAELLALAHEAVDEEMTDDAAMVERYGGTVRVTEGAYDNIKITTREDLDLAGWLLMRRGSRSD
jgi:2-C-methyl-D-erythritol 4-phosphate cytidylyltransferase